MGHKSRLTIISSMSAFILFGAATAQAASAQIHGQAALIGDAINSMPFSGRVYEAFKFPIGLGIEAKASNNLSVFLDLRAGYNDYPNSNNLLGNSNYTDDSTLVRQTTFPLLSDGGFGQRSELIQVRHAYLQYATELGLLKVGRMPRHWGLGMWRNAEFVPEGGATSSSDSLSFKVDFSQTLTASLYYDKYSEGSPTSKKDDVDGITVEAKVADDPTDANSLGFSREIGIAFSRYRLAGSDETTELKIFDVYGRLFFNKFLVEGEFFLPTGTTSNHRYAELGGQELCPGHQDAASKGSRFGLTCNGQSVESVMFLMKLKQQFGGGAVVGETSSTASIAATEVARSRLPTSQRPETHIIGLWTGFAKGDKDAFAQIKESEKDNKVSLASMHPNIRPSLLMFNNSVPSQPGMPGARVQNTIFARGEYTYESPSFGSITPSLIWGMLQTTNSNTLENASFDSSRLGKESSLGFELDVDYNYQTVDFVKWQVGAGVWFPGNAWETTESKPSMVFGARAGLSTSF